MMPRIRHHAGKRQHCAEYIPAGPPPGIEVDRDDIGDAEERAEQAVQSQAARRVSASSRSRAR